MVQFLLNKSGQPVPMAESKLLCSFHRPLSEAERWVSQFDLKSVRDAIVIGIGGGYHLKYLSLKYPDLNIHVFDVNTTLIEHYRDTLVNFRKIRFYSIPKPTDFYGVYDLMESKTPSILSFRPGWQASYEDFQGFMDRITMREAVQLKSYLDQSGVNISFRLDEVDEKNIYLTLKNLVISQNHLPSLDSKVIDYFGDLMK